MQLWHNCNGVTVCGCSDIITVKVWHTGLFHIILQPGQGHNLDRTQPRQGHNPDRNTTRTGHILDRDQNQENERQCVSHRHWENRSWVHYQCGSACLLIFKLGVTQNVYMYKQSTPSGFWHNQAFHNWNKIHSYWPTLWEKMWAWLN